MKIIKFASYDIPLKNIEVVEIDGKRYYKNRIERGEYYKLIKTNQDNITYVETLDHYSKEYQNKTRGKLIMYLKNKKLHNTIGAALIKEKVVDNHKFLDEYYYIDGSIFLSKDIWLKQSVVQQRIREEKLKRIDV